MSLPIPANQGTENTNAVRHGAAGFKERAPWWGGDLQTLRNYLISKRLTLPGLSTRRSFPVSDGSDDQLTGTLHRPAASGRQPLILLIHGLTGCEDSVYMRESTRFHLLRDRPVLRLNLRGAGNSGCLARGYYHAGCASDLQDVLDGLAPEEKSNGVFAIGFSLGGNILLNLLGGPVRRHGLIGAATVSAPIEPNESCRQLMAPRNMLYHRFLLRRMKQDVLSSVALTHKQRRAVRSASSVYEFDDKFVAPCNGFLNAQDYYEKTAGARQVGSIDVPTLMLHASNDPWVPASPYRTLQSRSPACVRIAIADGGGHVGFHAQGTSDTWHDQHINNFLQSVQSV